MMMSGSSSPQTMNVGVQRPEAASERVSSMVASGMSSADGNGLIGSRSFSGPVWA
jgi:hypothetical protein